MSINQILQRNVMPTLRTSTTLIGFAVPISTALDNLLLAIVLLGIFFNAPAVTQIILRNPVARAAVLLFGILTIATTYGTTPISEALGILGKYIDLAFIPLFMLMFVESKTRLWAERAFMAAMGLTLLISYMMQLNLVSIASWMTVFANDDNPVVFHSHITQNNMMAYAAFLALLNCRDALNGKLKMAWGIVAGLASINVLFMVKGRTGYVILVLLMCWFTWTTLSRYFATRGKVWGWKQGALLVLAATMLMVSAFWASPKLHDRVSVAVQEVQAWRPNSDNQIASAGLRLDFYYNTLQIVQRNWLLGVGTGGFTDAFAKQVQGLDTLPTHNPHNEYLMILVQTGVLGLLLLLYLFYTEWRVAPLLESPYAQDAARGLVLAFIVNCTFNSALHDHADGLFFAFMSALWFSTLRENKS